MTSFDEKSGSVEYQTPNYRWTQTVEDVSVFIDVPLGTNPKEIEVKVQTKRLRVAIKGKKTYIDGELFLAVVADSSFWTLEDKKEIRLVLAKAKQYETWKTVVVGDHEMDPFTALEMQKKIMLEKFQKENPGFDFSQAQFSGNVPDPATWNINKD